MMKKDEKSLIDSHSLSESTQQVEYPIYILILFINVCKNSFEIFQCVWIQVFKNDFI